MRNSLPLALVLVLGAACAAPPANLGCPWTRTSVAYDVRVRMGVEPLWASAKSTLSQLAHESYLTNDPARKFTTWFDGSRVTVTVEAYDSEQSLFHVSAVKLGAGDAKTATLITDKILADLERKH